ncbi:MAG: hypothetical protein L0Y55_15630, partial [Anaerolineales bacterium]|nr:hypothetical protein [Anaerolineales bacterium]
MNLKIFGILFFVLAVACSAPTVPTAPTAIPLVTPTLPPVATSAPIPTVVTLGARERVMLRDLP